MDINVLRIATTVLSFAVFIGILLWAFSRRNQPDFEAAAQLALAHDEDPQVFAKESDHA